MRISLLTMFGDPCGVACCRTQIKRFPFQVYVMTTPSISSDPKRSDITFISSNVGSLFPMNSHIYGSWNDCMKKFLIASQSKVVVIGMQEFGGKKPLKKEDGHRFFQDFYSLTQDLYDSMVVYYDDEVGVEAAYTALAVAILFSSELSPIKRFMWIDESYQNYPKGLTVSSFQEAQHEVIKEKFPLSHFPDEKYSRKGYCIIRIKSGRANDTKAGLDIVNLHMIHDADFRVGIQSTPSVFAEYRKKQMNYIAARLDTVKSQQAVLLGDFNYRTCVRTFLQKLYPNSKFDSDPTAEKVFVYSESGCPENLIATFNSKGLETKISLLDPKYKKILKESNIENPHEDVGCIELPLKFSPTYSFSEDEGSLEYIARRAPSWCDRICVRGKITKSMLKKSKLVKYDAYGFDVSIGDHKPVYLSFPMFFL